jgi:hypothetical protein
MAQNIGRADKAARLVLALVLLYAGWQYNNVLWVKYLCWIIAAVLVLTVVTGFCLPYKLLGISTAKKNK